MQRGIVLMVGLGRIDAFERSNAGGNRALEDMGAVELRNIGPSDLALGVIDREDRRPVLRTRVWPLPIELGRVIGYRELDLQDRPVVDDARVEGDFPKAS